MGVTSPGLNDLRLQPANDEHGGTKTINEDVGAMVAARDSGAHRIDQEALADAVTKLMDQKSGNKNKAIVSAILALLTVVGGGNWAVMSSGDADTQAIVRTELQMYGDKVEQKVKAERDLLRMEMQRDRDQVTAKIEGIEKATQQTAIDIAVIKSRLEK